MKRFAELLDRLSFQHGKNGKLALLVQYFRTAPDPDRGFALAAITGDLSFRFAKPNLVRALIETRVDPVLFALSLDYVGDLAETAALIWPAPASPIELSPSLGEIVGALAGATAAQIPALLAGWMDALDSTARWALIKLIGGALRVGVSSGLAREALAELGAVSAAEIEEAWYGVEPPYVALFAWLEKRGPKPAGAPGAAAYRPVMLAQPLEDDDLSALDPADYRAEWKWDGIRVQIGGGRIYSRSGDDITASFPELAELQVDAVLDGELLIIRDGEVAPFADLQRRLNRKVVSPTLQRDFPAGVRLYDILFDHEEDLRALPFDARRARLEDWYRREPRARLDLSALVPFSSWEELDRARRENQTIGVEGVMLKKRDSTYVAGRPKGPWFKWKREPHTVDAVLMYAQRGHGKRSSYYSDYTFGVWKDEELVPVGKAYFGFTDAELAELDKFVRAHTINKFGPVREVDRTLVLEVAFEGLARSNRHKSGVAMRFPRIARIRWDKAAREADRLETLLALLPEAE